MQCIGSMDIVNEICNSMNSLSLFNRQPRHTPSKIIQPKKCSFIKKIQISESTSSMYY